MWGSPPPRWLLEVKGDFMVEGKKGTLSQMVSLSSYQSPQSTVFLRFILFRQVDPVHSF